MTLTVRTGIPIPGIIYPTFHQGKHYTEMLRFITSSLEAHNFTKTLPDMPEEGEVPLQRLPARIKNCCGPIRNEGLERVPRVDASGPHRLTNL